MDILEGKNNTDEEVSEVVGIMKECGALEACYSLAISYLNGVQKTLSKYPDSEPRHLFEKLLEYMVKRGH